MGYFFLALLVLIIVLPLAGLMRLSSLPGFEPESLMFWQNDFIWNALFFSLWQAFLSTVLSVVPAIFVARAFSHLHDFPLRGFLLRLFALPLVIPAIVAVMGVVSVYGLDGWIPLGRDLYGLNGILLAHTFFNIPLAIILLLPVWQSIAKQHWQLGEQLKFGNFHRWRFIEWPMLRESLPGVMLLIFMLCLTSFAVVSSLGGGPKSSTIEVAIYQSLRFDFDPAQAVILALVQLTLCVIVALVTLKFQKFPEVEIGLATNAFRYYKKKPLFDIFVVSVAAIFVGLPLASMLSDGLTGPIVEVLSSAKLWYSAVVTLLIGLSASFIAVISGWFILLSSSELSNKGYTVKARLLELLGSITYVVPPLVLGTGIFVLMSPHVNVFDWIYPVVIVLNGIMGLPFVIRTLGPSLRQNRNRYQQLCQILDLKGWNRFKLIDWPLLRKPIGLSAALVAALAMGDLGVIALFGTAETSTLPLLVYRQLGAYMIPQATVSALFLLSLCLLVFWFLESYLGCKESKNV